MVFERNLTPLTRALALTLGLTTLLAPAHAVLPSVTTLVHFTGSQPAGGNGSLPNMALIESPDGYFYGRLNSGTGTVNNSDSGGDQRAMFRLRTNGTGFEVIRNVDMDSAPTNVRWLGASDGYLYSADFFASDVVRYRFGDTSWSTFHAGLGSVTHMLEADSRFYVLNGDRLGALTLSGGTYTNLYTRQSDLEGASMADVIKGSDGRLYGLIGGYDDSVPGSVFSVNTDGSDYRLVKRFDAGTNFPQSGGLAMLVEGGDGKLYGITASKLYRVNKDGSGFEEMHTFGWDKLGGDMPLGVMLGRDGHLYGITYGGGIDVSGQPAYGAIFRYRMGPNILEVLHSFGVPTDPPQNNTYVSPWNGQTYTSNQNIGSNAGGAQPRSLQQAANGDFYGVANVGGNSGWGTVFRFAPGDEVPPGSMLNDVAPALTGFGIGWSHEASTSLGLGTYTSLQWTTTGVANCTATSTEPGSAWTGSQTTSNTTGLRLTPTRVGTWTYTLTCAPQNTTYSAVSRSITVTVVPAAAVPITVGEGSGGGGGALAWLLAPLAGLGLLKARRRRREVGRR